MNFTFNHETREVHLDLSLNEWDTLQCFRHASVPFMSPFNTQSDLYKFYLELGRINHEITKIRIQS